ncbi:MAG TPA: HAMP domain-containing sensor histidine kinase [Candidatus Methanoperedens sp.]|nr:HAMP domain-containing sensor histidine kinase [Candidatus Methanoperedens sp.]
MPTGSMQRKLDLYEFLLDFIAHEIRNPLNSIIMFGNLLTEEAYGALPPQQKEVIGRILASAYRIEHMTGDFLNLRRVDGGEEMLHREWLDLRTDVVEATLRDLAAKFPDHAARLTRVQCAGCAAAARVFADRQMLRTVYDNLFFNALKYGKPGGRIVWGCAVRAGAWEMFVTNEGQGVRPEALAKIFTKFYRVQDEKLPPQPGTGLGLYNVQRIVRLHGGTINAASRYGRDFTMRFTLPRPAADAPARSRGAGASRGSGARSSPAPARAAKR